MINLSIYQLINFSFSFYVLFFIIGVIYGYENPERVVLIKMKIKKQFSPKVSKETGPLQKVNANSFNVEFLKII